MTIDWSALSDDELGNYMVPSRPVTSVGDADVVTVLVVPELMAAAREDAALMARVRALGAAWRAELGAMAAERERARPKEEALRERLRARVAELRARRR